MLDPTIFTYSLKCTHKMKEILNERSLICTCFLMWSLFHAASVGLLENGINNELIKHIFSLCGLLKVKKVLCVLVQNGVCVFNHRGPGRPTNYQANSNKILRILRYPRYIYTAKTLYGDTGELIIEELLQRGELTMSRTVKTVADRLTQNMEGQYCHFISQSQNLAALLLVF